MQRLLLLGLNHTTAPLEVREKLAFSARQQQEALAAFRRKFESCEAVLLSTCNRVELYTARAVHAHPRAEEMVQFLADFHETPAEHFRDHLYERSDRGVVEHLFNVASSLDSMVLGETQILGQVREAYDAARQLDATGSNLNPLFQRAIAVGKQVIHDTPLAEGRVSVASVGVDYARRIFEHFGDKTILCIGAGKMAALVLQSFVSLAPKRLLICNRDATKAAVLASRFNGEAVAFENLTDHLIAADIVVTSTGSEHPIITRTQFEGLRRKRRYRPIFLIDIALPRDVDASVGEIESVYLYNLDDLQKVVSATHSQRQDAIDAARAIVAAHVDQFLLADRAREMGPVIDQLSRRYHELAQEELSRTLSKLPNISEGERGHLEDLTRRIVNKLLHDPIQALRRSDTPHAPASQYLHALEKLFKLDQPPEAADESETRGEE